MDHREIRTQKELEILREGAYSNWREELQEEHPYVEVMPQTHKKEDTKKKKKKDAEMKEELSIDDMMKISQEHNRKSPEEKKAANKKAMGNVKKVAPKKDTRTDVQKMADATDERPGSFYRNMKR